ncbi:MAG: PorV/PorQ family protein [Candidatus Desantisbacteria bacterium]
MKRKILVSGLGVLLAGQVYANFQFEGVGARSLGMGGAFTAIANDSSCLYYNPAGLARIKEKEQMYMYSRKLNELAYQYVGLVWEKTGFSYLNQQGNLQKAENMWGDKAGESVYGVSYANMVNERLSVGGSMKILALPNDRKSGTGFALDGGLLYKPDIPQDVNVGFVIRNLGAKIQGESYDLGWALGVAKKQNLKIGKKEGGYNILMALDLYSKRDDNDKMKIKCNLGAETQVFDIIFLRMGFNGGDFTTGIGLKNDKWNLDYAYIVEDSMEGADKYFVSVSMRF